MSRFSIRTQILGLAGVFTTLLLVTVAILSTMIFGLVERVEQTNVGQSQARLIAAIKEDLDQVFVSILLIDRSEEGAFESLAENLGEIVDAGDSAATAFANAPQATQAAVMGVIANAQNLQSEVPALQSALSFELSRDLRNRVIPAVNADLAALDQAQDQVDANLDALMSQKQQMFAEQKTMLAISATVVISVSVALALLFALLMSKPIRAIVADVKKIEDGDFDFEMPTARRGDEIGQISRQLETLRGELARSAEQTQLEGLANDRRVALFDTLSASMSALKNGQLGETIDSQDWADLGDRYVTLCDDFNDLAQSLDNLVSSVRASVDTVETNAAELATMSMDMSKRAEIQAATLEESAAALEELSTSVKSAASRAQEADEKVIEGRRRAQQGGEVMARARSAMGSISKSSEKITQIIGVIDDIAFQTNLLALNAGVEAARAGESGKGFSVVASEVRSLAQRASESAREIKDLVSTSTQQVDDGEKLVEETSATLQHIVESVTEVSDLVSEIANAAREQAAGVQEITVGVGELDKATQQNAALVGETSAAGEQLKREVASVSSRLAAFSGGAAIALAETMPTPDFAAPSGLPTSDVGWSSDLDVVPVPAAEQSFDLPEELPVAVGATDNPGYSNDLDWKEF